MKDKGLIMLASSPVLRDEDPRAGKSTLSRARGCGESLAHEISQMKEGWERYGQSLDGRLGRLALGQRLESPKRQEIAFEVEGAEAAAQGSTVMYEKVGNSLAALHQKVEV